MRAVKASFMEKSVPYNLSDMNLHTEFNPHFFYDEIHISSLWSLKQERM